MAAREASGGGAISGAISSEAISEASAGGASEAKSEAKSKLGKQAAKAVTQLDAVIQVLGEVEVFTADDWWNARIEKIVLESRKSARITVSYEQSPGLYAVQPEDEIEFVVRQADGIWAYDRIRYRQPGQAVALAAVAGGTGMEAGGAARAALAPAPAPAPPAPMTSVKRELMMPGMAGVSGGLVEGLQKGITPPAPMSYAKEEAGNEEAVKEPRSTYYPGHPCFWPLFYTRTDGTKLILTKVKEYPHAYKRVRVTHGKEGDVANARNSWMRDLEKEREERRRLGQPSPGLDVDSNKSSPIVASPSNAPPVLSHNRAVAASSLEPGVLLAPQVVRVRRSDKQADGKSPALSHHAPAHHAPAHHARPHDATSHAPEALAGNGAERQDARSSASPAVEPDASDEQAGALRLKVLHALALEDLTKAQLKDKLKAKVPKQMLKELARRVETPGESDRDKCKYKLQPAVWQEVQVDTWNEYSEDDRTFLRIRKTRAQEDAPSTAPSPAQARASHSPMNLDAPTGDKARLEADEAGGRGATLRGAGSQGSAFEDVKGGGRCDSAAGAAPKSSPSCLSPVSPTDAKQEEGGRQPREPGIPRKRGRDSSEPLEPSAKEARKSEATSSSSSSSVPPMPSSSLPPSRGPPPADRDRDHDRDRDRNRDRDRDRVRESERQGDGRKTRTDSSVSPGVSLCASLCVLCIWGHLRKWGHARASLGYSVHVATQPCMFAALRAFWMFTVHFEAHACTFSQTLACSPIDLSFSVVHACVCACECLCVRERERESESLCVCVCVCVLQRFGWRGLRA